MYFKNHFSYPKKKKCHQGSTISLFKTRVAQIVFYNVVPIVFKARATISTVLLQIPPSKTTQKKSDFLYSDLSI